MSDEPKPILPPFIVEQYPDDALEAWHLWHRLNNYANELWNKFEKDFLEFCIEADKDNLYNRPLPFD